MQNYANIVGELKASFAVLLKEVISLAFPLLIKRIMSMCLQ